MCTIRSFIIATMLMLMTSLVYAQDKPADKISLYQAPDANSAVVGSIATGEPMMPIFTQGEWTKIADPSNGNVGWVSNETLKQQQAPVIKTVTQTLNSPNAPNVTGYKLMQFGSSTPLDQKQIDEMMKNWQAQQTNLQHIFGQLLQQNATTLNNLAKEMQQQNIQLPMILPVVVMPNTNTNAATSTTQPAAETKKST